MRIIIIGLDNAGKTTILCKHPLTMLISDIDRLHLDEIVPTVPSKYQSIHPMEKLSDSDILTLKY